MQKPPSPAARMNARSAQMSSLLSQQLDWHWKLFVQGLPSGTVPTSLWRLRRVEARIAGAFDSSTGMAYAKAMRAAREK